MAGIEKYYEITESNRNATERRKSQAQKIFLESL